VIFSFLFPSSVNRTGNPPALAYHEPVSHNRILAQPPEPSFAAAQARRHTPLTPTPSSPHWFFPSAFTIAPSTLIGFFGRYLLSPPLFFSRYGRSRALLVSVLTGPGIHCLLSREELLRGVFDPLVLSSRSGPYFRLKFHCTFSLWPFFTTPFPSTAEDTISWWVFPFP